MHDSGIQKEMAVVFFPLCCLAGLHLYLCICGGVGLCSQKGWKRAKEVEGEVLLMSM